MTSIEKMLTTVRQNLVDAELKLKDEFEERGVAFTAYNPLKNNAKNQGSKMLITKGEVLVRNQFATIKFSCVNALLYMQFTHIKYDPIRVVLVTWFGTIHEAFAVKITIQLSDLDKAETLDVLSDYLKGFYDNKQDSFIDALHPIGLEY